MGRMITLPAHYYKQHDADVGLDHPGQSFDGWTTRLLDVPLEKTALVSMHVSNQGLDDQIPAGLDSPYAGWYRFVEYLSRSATLSKTVFPPLMQAARDAQMTVIHVGSSAHYCEQYAGFQKAKALAGDGPERQDGAVEDDLRQQWQRERSLQMQGAHNIEDIQAGRKKMDFAPQAKPLADEPVVINSHQLNAVCRARGIWHLVYVGFAINWCLLASPGGMIDMSRLGYVCSTIRQATSAVENAETCSEEWAKKVALWRVALMFGYVFDVDPFVGGLKRV